MRRILGQLKKAGLVKVHAAAGGTFLRRAPAGISLLDVYRAVEVVAEGKLFHVHEGPNPRCPMGRNIQAALDATLVRAQAELERGLSRVTLAQVVADMTLSVSA